MARTPGGVVKSAKALEVLMRPYYDTAMEPPPPTYALYDTKKFSNLTMHLGGRKQVVAAGQQEWNSRSAGSPPMETSNFFVLPSLMTRKEVSAMRKLLRNSTADADKDSVDGQQTRELVLERNGSYARAAYLPDKADGLDPRVAYERRELRRSMGAITRPIMEERITPFLRARYPELCARSAERACTPCQSIIRRYERGQRRTHQVHFDLEAAVSVVVSLSDYGKEHLGGFQIQAAGGAKAQVLPLRRGDAVVHESDLLHGVHLPDDDGERWSWVMWYKDSTTCTDHGEEWHAACAAQGNSLCQYLQSMRVRRTPPPKGSSLGSMALPKGPTQGAKPKVDNEVSRAERVKWVKSAAEQGLGRAMDRYAVLLHTGQGVPRDDAQAAIWMRRAIAASGEANAHCRLGQMLWEGSAFPSTPRGNAKAEAAAHFRMAAARGSPSCNYNIGVLHLKGIEGVAVKNEALAMRWLARANTAEAMHAMGIMHNSAGRLEEAEHWLVRAHAAGLQELKLDIERLREHRRAVEPAAKQTGGGSGSNGTPLPPAALFAAPTREAASKWQHVRVEPSGDAAAMSEPPMGAESYY